MPPPFRRTRSSFSVQPNILGTSAPIGPQRKWVILFHERRWWGLATQSRPMELQTICLHYYVVWAKGWRVISRKSDVSPQEVRQGSWYARDVGLSQAVLKKWDGVAGWGGLLILSRYRGASIRGNVPQITELWNLGCTSSVGGLDYCSRDLNPDALM